MQNNSTNQKMYDKHDHHDHFHLCNMRCLSWPAIIFGALTAIALSFLFNLFSLSVGLTAFPVSPEGKQAFAAWGFVWLVIIAIITMFVSGWIAGFLGRAHCHKRKLGELYGFGAWALALVVTIFLASQAGQFVSQRGYLVDRNMTAVRLSSEIAANVNEAAAAVSRTNTPPATQEAVTSMGIASFATFFILFIGALSATFGGRCGMKCKCKNMPENCPKC